MPDDRITHPTRRCCMLAGALAALSVAIDAAARQAGAASEVWIELSEPVAAGAQDAAQAQQRRLRVAAQQDRVAQRLRELGVAELGRIVHSRNAILARVTPQQTESVLAIEGVQRLRPAQTLHPPKPMP
jgi:hypothetical protein